MKALWLVTSSMNLEPITNSFPAPVVSYEDLCLDKDTFPGVDAAMLAAVELYQPELVLFIGAAEGALVPKVETLLKIKALCPSIHLCCDGASPGWWPRLGEYAQARAFTFTVNIDGVDVWPCRKEDLTLWPPLDPSPYTKDLKKDILLGFAGGRGSEERRDILRPLVDENLLELAERKEERGTYQDYADFLLRSRLLLNIPGMGVGGNHVKARVYEAGLAGCCLLERKGAPTRRWLTPNVEYLEYETLDDIRKIRQTYASDLEAREVLQGLPHPRRNAFEKIAANLQRAVHLTYSARNFWERVLEHLAEVAR